MRYHITSSNSSAVSALSTASRVRGVFALAEERQGLSLRSQIRSAGSRTSDASSSGGSTAAIAAETAQEPSAAVTSCATRRLRHSRPRQSWPDVSSARMGGGVGPWMSPHSLPAKDASSVARYCQTIAP
ncbi:hypothetical protein C3486_21540 [Streptomyces sp. Ru73]|nr:hypothetical protein C3486_21540 [Streptomyces sp. Ru73]